MFLSGRPEKIPLDTSAPIPVIIRFTKTDKLTYQQVLLLGYQTGLQMVYLFQVQSVFWMGNASKLKKQNITLKS